MTEHFDVTREQIFEAKSEMRKQRAGDSFDEKMVALVKMQMIHYEIALANGRPARKPWHYDNPEVMKAIAEYKKEL